MPDVTREELLKKIKADELAVIICSPGSTPLLKIDIVLRECALCHQVVHMAADNVEVAGEMTPICGPCYMVELMPDAPVEQQMALMGGHRLSFPEAMQAALAMLKPSKEEN